MDMPVYNNIYADWTKRGIYLFNSEFAVENQIIYAQFNNDTPILDEVEDFVAGDSDGSYTSSGVIDVNENGTGYVAAVAYFKNADTEPPSSLISNIHTNYF